MVYRDAGALGETGARMLIQALNGPPRTVPDGEPTIVPTVLPTVLPTGFLPARAAAPHRAESAQQSGPMANSHEFLTGPVAY